MASAKDKLEAVTAVREPLDVNYDHVDLKLWTYNFRGKSEYDWNFESQMTDVRVMLNITQASTVEIDLDDSDFQVLQDPLFAQWAWNIEDVSFSSQKKFKTTRLQNSTSTTYLGDSADLEWVLGQKPIDFKLNDQILFRLCGLQSQQTSLTLTLEDRAASYLRDKKGAKSWSRGQHTRAQFIAMLCREAGVEYFIPELNVAQPIQATTDTSTDPVSAAVAKLAGFHFTDLGKSVFTAGQMTFIQELASLTSLDPGVVAAWVYAEENGASAQSREQSGNHNWLNIGYFDSGAGSIAFSAAFRDPTTAARQTGQFLSGTWGGASAGIRTILKFAGGDASAQITAIQNSGWATSHYPTLPQIYTQTGKPAVSGIPASTGAGTPTTTGNYAFTRGANETSWDCIQRLASEVAWYTFVRQNRLWFVSGNYLFSQVSQMTLERGQNGVDYIDPDLDLGERDGIAQCMVYARTGLWTALPGMVVTVKNRGPASGKWIVASVDSHPRDASQQCIITLQKPIPKRAEPAQDNTNSSSNPNPATPTSTAGTPGGAYWAAKQLSDKKLIYTQANRTLVPLSQISQGETLYDCSASVSWVLLRGGFALPGQATWGSWAPVSGDFFGGGAGGALVAGKGQQMTIWANAEHVFIEFNIPGVGHYQGNTVNPFGNGFGLFQWNTPATGGWGGPNPGNGAPTFYPVHYPGT